MYRFKKTYQIILRKMPSSDLYRFRGACETLSGQAVALRETLFQKTCHASDLGQVQDWMQDNFEAVRYAPSCFDDESKARVLIGRPLQGYYQTINAGTFSQGEDE